VAKKSLEKFSRKNLFPKNLCPKKSLAEKSFYRTVDHIQILVLIVVKFSKKS